MHGGSLELVVYLLHDGSHFKGPSQQTGDIDLRFYLFIFLNCGPAIPTRGAVKGTEPWALESSNSFKDQFPRKSA